MKPIASLMVFLALAPPAWAAPRLHLVTPYLPAPLVTDNARYAAWVGPVEDMTVLDTRTDSRAEMQLLPGCSVADGDASRFLVNCPARIDGEAPHVLDAATETLFTVPGEDRIWSPEEEFFWGIGRRWLVGTNDHDVTFLYLDWRTGRLVGFAEDLGVGIPRDLDSPRLTHVAPATVSRFGRYSLRMPGRSRFPSLILAGRRGRITLDDCYPGGCSAPSIGPRVAVWTRGATVHAYVLATGERLHWMFRPQVIYSQRHLAAAVTANRIFFNVPRDVSGRRGYRVLVARLPR